MRATEAIAEFVKDHPSDLLARWSPEMETQINVAPGNGKRVGKQNVWEADGERWWHIRVPKDARSNPHWNDYQLQFDLPKHISLFGMTGWDWVNRVSRWVGFDFDSITGHAAGVGVDDDTLAEVRENAKRIPWVEVRTSKSGKGLHLYAPLPNIPTANHTEHAALGRAVMGRMSLAAGFVFVDNADKIGGNMWVWSKDTKPGGLILLKEATATLSVEELGDWRAHVDVVTRKRSRVQVAGVDQGDFDRLSSDQQRTPIEPAHKETMAALEKSGFSFSWLPDYHCIHTHTCALAKVPHKGVFTTASNGTDPGQPNCFAFPLMGGEWNVYRFGEGTRESDTWTQDERWTWCRYNCQADLVTAARAFGGAQQEGRQEYSFTDGTKALEALGFAGALAGYEDRPATLDLCKGGKLVVYVKQQRTPAINEAGRAVLVQEKPLPGWTADRGGKNFCKTLDYKEPKRNIVADHYVRTLISSEGDYMGTYVKSNHGTWDHHVTATAKDMLVARGLSPKEAGLMLGAAALDRWQSVSIPFGPEFPGARQWNRNAAQFLCTPAPKDSEPNHPHWDLVCDNLGESLTPYIKDLPGIETGGDYLKAWLACLVQDPLCHLPYLFLFGEQNCGKSTLWEAIQHSLFTGVAEAERALLDEGTGFNKSLEGTVLCVLDDVDLSKAGKAPNRIKRLVTSPTLQIRRMRLDEYKVVNTTKWMHLANSPDELPVYAGDTRMTIIPVAKPTNDIPKEELLERMNEEAPSFLRTLLDWELPPRAGRLRLPVIVTEAKTETIKRQHPVMRFIGERCTVESGQSCKAKDLFKAYDSWHRESCISGTPSASQFGKDLLENLVGKVERSETRYVGIGFLPPEEVVPLSS